MKFITVPIALLFDLELEGVFIFSKLLFFKALLRWSNKYLKQYLSQ